MTSHELAKALLDGPDLPITLKVDAGGDSAHADVGECQVKVTEMPIIMCDEESEYVKTVVLSGWATDCPMYLQD